MIGLNEYTVEKEKKDVTREMYENEENVEDPIEKQLHIKFDEPVKIYNSSKDEILYETKYFMVSESNIDSLVSKDEEGDIIAETLPNGETYVFACDENYEWLTSAEVQPISTKDVLDADTIADQMVVFENVPYIKFTVVC